MLFITILLVDCKRLEEFIAEMPDNLTVRGGRTRMRTYFFLYTRTPNCLHSLRIGTCTSWDLLGSWKFCVSKRNHFYAKVSIMLYVQQVCCWCICPLKVDRLLCTSS